MGHLPKVESMANVGGRKENVPPCTIGNLKSQLKGLGLQQKHVYPLMVYLQTGYDYVFICRNNNNKI